MNPIKSGTKIEVFVSHPQGQNERAHIARWTRASGPRREGWYIVRFADGGKLCIHQDNFKVLKERSRTLTSIADAMAEQ